MSSRQFEHTADLGIEVDSPTLDKLFGEAAEAMMGCFITSMPAPEPGSFEIAASSTDLDLLLVDWLNEILMLFELQEVLAVVVEARVERRGDLWQVDGSVRGTPHDAAVHEISTPIKAVTLHRLQVARTRSGWHARVLFDL